MYFKYFLNEESLEWNIYILHQQKSGIVKIKIDRERGGEREREREIKERERERERNFLRGEQEPFSLHHKEQKNWERERKREREKENPAEWNGVDKGGINGMW